MASVVPAPAAMRRPVTYTVTSQWPGGFGADVTVTNVGDALDGWQLTWTFGVSVQIRNGVLTTVGINAGDVAFRRRGREER